jgi:hypothetical protein
MTVAKGASPSGTKEILRYCSDYSETSAVPSEPGNISNAFTALQRRAFPGCPDAPPPFGTFSFAVVLFQDTSGLWILMGRTRRACLKNFGFRCRKKVRGLISGKSAIFPVLK